MDSRISSEDDIDAGPAFVLPRFMFYWFFLFAKYFRNFFLLIIKHRFSSITNVARYILNYVLYPNDEKKSYCKNVIL